MAELNNNKPSGPAKSFMTIGPTLHYSHANVHSCWGLSLAVYIGVCFFWIRLISGQALVLDLMQIFRPQAWDLGRVVTHPLSIYEYPWQITVLGAVMGVLAVTPLLTAQLLSFRYSIPMILSVILVARLPALGLFLLAGCLAVACRPLRFRSRIIALALCMSPAMVYWAVFGGSQSSDPIRWGISYAPWIYAWLTGLLIAGLSIGIGPFTRYRPGLIWSITLLIGVLAYLTFHLTVGFDELDYQLYVARNNPEEQVEFYDRSLTREIDAILNDEIMYSEMAGYFYPTDKIELRKKLKAEIENLLYYNRWPHWFQKNLPDELKYHARSRELLAQYNTFIENRSSSRRVPIALYFKAMIHEYHPDARYFGQTEMLRFYHDYPFYENFHIWQDLLFRFPNSPESLEARWRIAVQEAGNERFKEALGLCEVGQALLDQHLAADEAAPPSSAGLMTAFQPPAGTAMTRYKLQSLRLRLAALKGLLSAANQGTGPEEKQRLARFAVLNPYSRNYARQLDELLAPMSPEDPLRDNVLLARAKLNPDLQLRARAMQEIMDSYPDRDGSVQALYELGMVNVQQWKEMKQEDRDKLTHLTEARSLLSRYAETYPQSAWAESARRTLASLPQVE